MSSEKNKNSSRTQEPTQDNCYIFEIIVKSPDHWNGTKRRAFEVFIEESLSGFFNHDTESYEMKQKAHSKYKEIRPKLVELMNLLDIKSNDLNSLINKLDLEFYI